MNCLFECGRVTVNPDWVYAPKKGKTIDMASKYVNDTLAHDEAFTTDFKMLWKMGDASAGVCSYCGDHRPAG